MPSLGIVTVTTHGTPVALASVETRCSQYFVQPRVTLGASGTPPTGNGGTIYILDTNTAKTATGAHVLMALDPGADTYASPASAKNGYDLSKIYMDSDTDLDGALISYV